MYIIHSEKMSYNLKYPCHRLVFSISFLTFYFYIYLNGTEDFFFYIKDSYMLVIFIFMHLFINTSLINAFPQDVYSSNLSVAQSPSWSMSDHIFKKTNLAILPCVRTSKTSWGELREVCLSAGEVRKDYSVFLPPASCCPHFWKKTGTD